MTTPSRVVFLTTVCFFTIISSQCIKEQKDDVCHLLIDDTTVPKPEDCQILSCDSNVTFQLKDGGRGKVQIGLPSIPSSCNVTRYEVALKVRDKVMVTEPAVCSNQDTEWQTHSRRNVFIKFCDKNNATCIAESQPCDKIHKVMFSYVYTGWYQIRVTPHLGPNTRRSQRSKSIHMESSYIPQGLVDLNSTLSSLQYRDDNSESRVSFLFAPDVGWNDVDRFLVTMRLFGRVDVSLGSTACYASGYEHSCCAFYGEQPTECMAINGSAPNCYSTNNTVQCIFRNMTPGAYCAVLTFHDDRCEPETVWTGADNRPCQWQAYKVFEAEAIRPDGTVVHSSSGLIYLVVGILVIAAAASGALIFIQRHRARSRERSAHQVLSSERPRFTVEATRHFSLANQFTLTERPRPEVVLLYSRDSKPFMDLVAALRKVLDKICKCHVYDYFDEVHWNNVSVDPEGWVRELIIEREAKVVVVASRVAALRHNSRDGDLIPLKDPHPFDHLFLFALKLIRDVANDESYRNHFVVSFDGYTDSNHYLEDLNPYTRFVLPKHLNKLFEHLHDSNTTVHFDTNRRLEERDEVRQLRLRLEHLINVKLLGMSKHEQGQIYDW